MRRAIAPKLRRFARAMRNEPTDGEAAMWSLLRGKRLGGLRFRRQHPIAGYIVDFICLDAKLIVEVDGSQHAASPRDAMRDSALAALGYRTVRFWNDDIMRNSDGVARDILFHAGRLGG